MPKTKKQGELVQSPVNSNNMLYVMMGVITLFLIFLTIKVYSLEKKIVSGNAGGVAVAQQESPLSIANLTGKVSGSREHRDFLLMDSSWQALFLSSFLKK